MRTMCQCLYCLHQRTEFPGHFFEDVVHGALELELALRPYRPDNIRPVLLGVLDRLDLVGAESDLFGLILGSLALLCRLRRGLRLLLGNLRLRQQATEAV